MEAEDPYFTAAALFPEHDWHTVDDKPGPLICEPREHIVRCYSCRHWLRVLGLLACTARQEGYDSGKADGIREGLEKAAGIVCERCRQPNPDWLPEAGGVHARIYHLNTGESVSVGPGHSVKYCAAAAIRSSLREAQGEQPSPDPKPE
jgi:hypothetical protein